MRNRHIRKFKVLQKLTRVTYAHWAMTFPNSKYECLSATKVNSRFEKGQKSKVKLEVLFIR